MTPPDLKAQRTLRRVAVVTLLLVVGGYLSLVVGMRAVMERKLSVSPLNNGRNIFTILNSLEEDRWMRPDKGWPSSAPLTGRWYRSSSELFADLVESNELEVAYNFFTAPRGRIKPAKDRAEFTDGTLRNIWCVTLDVTRDLDPGAPVLFTQNFRFDSRGPDATLNTVRGLEPKARPYGDRGGIVITRSGAGMILSGKNAIWTTPATNRFLWPLSTGQDLKDRDDPASPRASHAPSS